MTDDYRAALHPGVYTVRFATSQNATPDVAVAIADAGCRFADVQVNGHGAPSLSGYALLELVRPLFH